MADLASPDDNEPHGSAVFPWAALAAPEDAAAGAGAPRIYLDGDRLKYGGTITPGGRLVAFAPS